MPGTNWRITTFRGNRVVNSSAWAASPTSLTSFVDAMISDGTTPAASGIHAAVAGGITPGGTMVNNPNNVMIVLTDGAPNITFSGDTDRDYMAAGLRTPSKKRSWQGSRSGRPSPCPLATATRVWKTPGPERQPWHRRRGRGRPFRQRLERGKLRLAGHGPDQPSCPRLSAQRRRRQGLGQHRAPADATTFSGKVDAGGAGLTWSNLGFGQFSAAIPVSIGSSHVVTENAPANGWTTTGYALGSSDSNGLPVCPTTMASYTGTSITVPAGSGQAVVCVANGKAPVPALTLDKTTTATGYAAVGDSISYSYLLTNQRQRCPERSVHRDRRQGDGDLLRRLPP